VLFCLFGKFRVYTASSAGLHKIRYRDVKSNIGSDFM